jgi:outer membrane lipoprotein-sorting protein
MKKTPTALIVLILAISVMLAACGDATPANSTTAAASTTNPGGIFGNIQLPASTPAGTTSSTTGSSATTTPAATTAPVTTAAVTTTPAKTGGSTSGNASDTIKKVFEKVLAVKSYRITATIEDEEGNKSSMEGVYIAPGNFHWKMEVDGEKMETIIIDDEYYFFAGGEWSHLSSGDGRPGITNSFNFKELMEESFEENVYTLLPDTRWDGKTVGVIKVEPKEKSEDGSVFMLYYDKQSLLVVRAFNEPTGSDSTRIDMRYSNYNDSSLKIEPPKID